MEMEGESGSSEASVPQIPANLSAILLRIENKLSHIESKLDTQVSRLDDRIDEVIKGFDDQPKPDKRPEIVPADASVHLTTTTSTASPAGYVLNKIFDPGAATKHILDDYLEKAVDLYSKIAPDTDMDEVSKRFADDFSEWQAHHFDKAAKGKVQALRDCLLAVGLPVRKEARIRMGTALVSFKDTLSSEARKTEEKMDHNRRPFVGTGIRTPIGHSTSHNPQSIATGQTNRIGATSYNKIAPKPADVSRALPAEARYEGKPSENIRRKFDLFLTACRISGLDTTDHGQMLDVMSLNWLCGAAQRYFSKHLKHVISIDEAISSLESHFLHVRARRVNEEKWNSLTYSLVRAKQLGGHMSDTTRTHEGALNLLFSEIEELADLRVSMGSIDEAVLSKIIAAVRTDGMFRDVCKQPPNTVEEMKTLLLGIAIEADNIQASSTSYYTNDYHDDTDSFYIDRKYKRGHSRSTRRVPGYGARYNTGVNPSANRNKPQSSGQDNGLTQRPNSAKFSVGTMKNGRTIAPNQCIVCEKYGCHSSRHRLASQTYISILNSPLSDSDEEDVENGAGDTMEPGPDNENFASYVSFLTDAFVCNTFGLLATASTGLQGIIVDTGTSVLSTIDQTWLHTLETITGKKINVSRRSDDRVTLRGLGVIRIDTLGSFIFILQFGGIEYPFRVFIVKGHSPFLLSHRDMDNMKLSYHSLEKKVFRPSDGYSEDVVWFNDLPHLPILSASYLTESQLMNVHRSLGHAPPAKVVELLKSANSAEATVEVRKAIEKLIENCKTCNLKPGPPQRFLFSSRYKDTGEFNSYIYVDIMKLVDGNVLHCVCAGTGFQSGRFVPDMSAASAWQALCSCWIWPYAGPPDVVVHDAGTNFASKEFKDSCSAVGVSVVEVPTEAHHTVGIVERQHHVVRTIYEKFKIDFPDLAREKLLELTLRAVNDAPGPSGVSPTILVYGIPPKLPVPQRRDTTFASRVIKIKDATILATKFKAQRVLNEASRRKHTPNMSLIRALETLLPGEDVLVYRESGGWTVYPFVRLQNDGVVVQLPSKQSKFAVTHCRPVKHVHIPMPDEVIDPKVEHAEFSEQEREEWNRPLEMSNAIEVPDSSEDSINSPDIENIKGSADMSCVDSEGYLSFGYNIDDIGDSSFSDFTETRNKELQGLMQLGTFEVVSKRKVGKNRLYDYVFVDRIKPGNVKKSRFCVRAYADRNHGLLTAAPTIQRLSLRTLLATSKKFRGKTRDITQAFLNAKSFVRREIYVRAPPEMGLGSDCVLRILKPLYGLPESPLHWFETYTSHFKENLDMTATPSDPCLLYTKARTNCSAKEQSIGAIGLQVDDSIVFGNDVFHKREENNSSEFPNKGSQDIDEQGVTFNGLEISRDAEKDLILSQKVKVSEIVIPVDAVMTYAEFKSIHAKCAYIAHSCQPLILFTIAKLSQVTDKTFVQEHVQALCSVTREMRTHNALKYSEMMNWKPEITVCVNAAFACNSDGTSQIGVLAMLRDSISGRCSILHYVSAKTKRVCRSVLAAEVMAMIEGFDVGFICRDVAVRLLGTHLPLVMCTDSRSCYHLAISLTRTRERRLQIDLHVIREAYEKRNIMSILWIKGGSNPADGLTKTAHNSTLYNLVRDHVYQPDTMSHIARDNTQPVRTEHVASQLHENKTGECRSAGEMHAD